jgi:xanthine phosphoribosyltransferase
VIKKYYSYEEFRDDTKELIKRVKSFEPEAIVGIARGGLTLSHCMAEGLNLREVQTIRTELYDGSCKRQDISLFGVCDFKNVKRVLVLDDIADSGETLKAIMSYLELNFKDIEFQSATLFYKETSVYKPHFWINEAKEWIEFFWEKDYEAK